MKNIVKKAPFMAVVVAVSLEVTGQEQLNTAGRMLQDEERLTIGGYAQVDYNQPVGGDQRENGGLDVHRMVLMFGYKFTGKTQFITEVELEHVKEVYVEQAFLQHEILPWLKFRGGLMLVPMGIINEYHEPSTFNGVERPNVDKYIVPSTWREIGAGFTGTFPAATLSYQAYIMNGFNGYDGDSNLSGSNGFRKGRQKGAESFLSSPNLAIKISYFGLPGLQLGLSGYSGKSQSSLYDGLDRSDEAAAMSADSSVVGLAMIGADLRYQAGGLQLRAQFNYGAVSNSAAYNQFTGSDMGSAISGWYGEIAFNVLHFSDQFNTELIPFIRYEQYHTHAGVVGLTVVNPAYNRNDLTFGLGWKLDKGAMVKADYQLSRNESVDEARGQFNAGVAVWF